MQFWQLLLILVLILPLIYKYSFWLYTIQLKEYRWDRFKEYIFTPQWKSALFNFWFFIELPLLLLSASIFLDIYLIHIIHPIIFYFLVFVNIFVIWKIIRWRFLKPKPTGRLLITLLFLLFGFGIDLYFMIFGWYWNIIYLYIIWSLIFAPLIIFFYILLTLPIVNFLKNRKIKKAILKSQIKNKPIKIAVTWSYWKSSVKEFLSSILEQDWKTLKTPENINSELWVSAIVLNKLKSKYKYFVAEVWAYRIWEISVLWKIVNHKYWFLTAIGNQHIWLFWSQENIVKGKTEIAESVLKNGWILYVNIDNSEISKVKFPKKLNLIKYWKSKKADAKYKILEEKNWKTEFSFEYKKTNTKFKINLIWEHNILNITWVIAFCYDLGLKTTEIKKYLKNLKTPNSSKTIIKNWNNILIDDTYNLSEAGLKSGLDLFKNYKKEEKILVLDDILELWKQSENIHFEIWKKIAKNKIVNKVLFCGVNYKENFIEWLIEWWFDKNNIINNLDNILKKSVILFEWRNAKRYLNKINK